MARDIILSAELDLKRINAQIRKLEGKKIDLFSGDSKKLQKFQQPLGKNCWNSWVNLKNL